MSKEVKSRFSYEDILQGAIVKDSRTGMAIDLRHNNDGEWFVLRRRNCVDMTEALKNSTEQAMLKWFHNCR